MAEIKAGAFGTGVWQLQTDLFMLGFDTGTIDGKFGSKTEGAVKDFQYTWGLNIDGIVGDQTAAAIKEAAALLENNQWNPKIDPLKYGSESRSFLPSVIPKPRVSTSTATQGGVSIAGMNLAGLDLKWVLIGLVGVVVVFKMLSGRD